MKHVKWIFVVLLISSLTSFVEKDKPTGGLNVGDVAPDFTIESTSDAQHNFDLTDLKGKYVLLSFWASYDAQSRMQNASLSNALRSTSQDVEMVSVSFDEYQSVFQETIRKDQIVTPTCFVETKGEWKWCNYSQKHLCCRTFCLCKQNQRLILKRKKRVGVPNRISIPGTRQKRK